LIPGGGPDSLPGTATATDNHLGRRYSDLFLLLREERGLISQGTLKRRETSSRTGKGVAGIFHPHELLAPGGETGGDEAMKSRLQALIGSLQLAVRLAMKS
jgi:hypothetical protein